MRHPIQTQSAIDAILSEGWIRDVHWFTEIDSTNSAARRVVNDQTSVAPVLPALFVAERQTAGRGRLQRAWWSPAGCLMLTLAIPTQSLPVEPQNWSQLALVSGLAVANTVARFVDTQQVQLKWPNDVYAFQKKIAGILIESDAKVWLIGIGLNVRINWSAAPAEVADKATCLTAASGRDESPTVVLVELMEELHHTLADWRTGDFAWHAAWHQRCLLSGRVVHARIREKQEIVGVCEGVDPQGRLIVRDEGSVQFLTTGEVLSWQ